MTHTNDESQRFPETLEEKLTAHLMGELDPAGEAELVAALAADPALRARKVELEALVGTLRQTLPPAPSLAEDRRAELRQAAATVSAPASPRAGLLRLPQMMKWAAVFVAAAGGAWWFGDGALRPESSASEMASAPARDLRQDQLEALGYVDSADGSGESVAPPADGRRSFSATESREAARAQAKDGVKPQSGELGFAFDLDGATVQDLVAGLGYVDAEAPEQDSILRLEAMKKGGTFRGPGDSVPPGGGGGNFAFTPGSDQASLGAEVKLVTPTAPAAGGAPATTGAPSTPAPAGRGAALPGEGTPLSSYTYSSEAGDDRNIISRTENFYDDLVLGEDILDPFGEGDGGGSSSLSYSSRARIRGGLGEALEREQPRLIVIDGYGRRYHDQHVVEQYLCRKPKETPRDMFFRYYGDNPMVRAEEDALSTFAADVDTASYPLARKYLSAGNLPPKAAIRTEEFVNYFRHELAPPAEEDFAVTIAYAPTPFSGGAGKGTFRVGVKAREVDRESRKPLNLVFVVDRSGSMADGNRIELVKRSLELLVDQLRDDDTVGIVAFESSAHLVLEPTPGYERYQIREAVRSLTTGGSTNAEAGLVMGYALAEKAFRAAASNRVVLCSDGVANTGETDQGRILERIRRFSEQQIDLTAIGVGMGNHNDTFLEQIADSGNGACHYVDDFEEAKRVFVERFTGTMQTVARDVKIQIEFNPGVIKRWRQLGYENRAIADADFRNDAVDAGEIGAGHEVIGLYEAEGHMGVAIDDWVVKVRLRWFPDGSREAVEREAVLKLGEGTSRFDLADPRFRLGVVAAQYAEVLRRSYWAREDSYSDLVVEAEKLARDLPGDPQVRELRDMILVTRKLVDRLLPPQDELALLIDEARRLHLLEAEVDQVEGRSTELEARLGELRQRNDELEQQIRDLLGG